MSSDVDPPTHSTILRVHFARVHLALDMLRAIRAPGVAVARVDRRHLRRRRRTAVGDLVCTAWFAATVDGRERLLTTSQQRADEASTSSSSGRDLPRTDAASRNVDRGQSSLATSSALAATPGARCARSTAPRTPCRCRSRDPGDPPAASSCAWARTPASSSSQPSTLSDIISRKRFATVGTISILPPPNHCMKRPRSRSAPPSRRQSRSRP